MNPAAGLAAIPSAYSLCAEEEIRITVLLNRRARSKPLSSPRRMSTSTTSGRSSSSSCSASALVVATPTTATPSRSSSRRAASRKGRLSSTMRERICTLSAFLEARRRASLRAESLVAVPAPALGLGARGDLGACPGDREPGAAERVDPLAVRVARLLVVHKRVQRVSVVGELADSVGPNCRSDVRPLGAAADQRSAADTERRPVGRARAGAGAYRARVSLEEVDRAPLSVDKDVAEPGARHSDARRPSIVRCRQRVRRVPAATGESEYRDRQRAEEER